MHATNGIVMEARFIRASRDEHGRMPNVEMRSACPINGGLPLGEAAAGWRSRQRNTRAMTLFELIFAVGIVTIAVGGIFATFMQSRRLTEGSVYQNAALTIVQGYVEQIKNMDLGQMIGATGNDTSGNPVNPTMATTSFSIPVYFDKNTPDALKTSTGTPPTLAAINSGVTPTGVQDNLKGFDMAKDLTAVDMMTSTDSLSYATTTQATWQSVWPGASDYTTAVPASTTGKNHLHMNVWVWIKDESVAAHRSSKIYSITLIYTWAYADGGRIRYVTDTVRSLRSAVATN